MKKQRVCLPHHMISSPPCLQPADDYTYALERDNKPRVVRGSLSERARTSRQGSAASSVGAGSWEVTPDKLSTFTSLGAHLSTCLPLHLQSAVWHHFLFGCGMNNSVIEAWPSVATWKVSIASELAAAALSDSCTFATGHAMWRRCCFAASHRRQRS